MAKLRFSQKRKGATMETTCGVLLRLQFREELQWHIPDDLLDGLVHVETVRWDILVKVYKRIEAHCNLTIGGHHLLLSDEERRSLILATAYNEEWYCIVKEVCDRKRHY